MGTGSGFKYIFILTGVFYFCSPVQANGIYSDDVDAKGFAVAASTNLNKNKPCTLQGIKSDYVNVSFIRGFFPDDKKVYLTSVKWVSKDEFAITFDGSVYSMQCNSVNTDERGALNCWFNKAPPGVESITLSIERVKQEEGCSEIMTANGQFNKWVIAKGYTQLNLHQMVAVSLLKPYKANGARRIAGEVVHLGTAASKGK
jgi:hypothetical protein